MTKTRFNYTPWYDEGGNLLGTTIGETGGYFAGIPPDVLAAHAEAHCPQYSGGNLSETFWAIYFNHTLRQKLREMGLGLQEEEDNLNQSRTTTDQTSPLP